MTIFSFFIIVVEISTSPILAQDTVGLTPLLIFFRFYHPLNRWASAKFMHFIKYIRIWASEENSKCLLTVS